MEPLVEYPASFGGWVTRVLELEGEGPPLAFFHGYADSADTWRLMLAELGRRGRRAIAVDLPGFAAADRLRPAGAVLPQRAAVAEAGLESTGAGAIAVGTSLGGCVPVRA